MNFPPTMQAAHARVAAVRPNEYARTRNFLDGAVTGLSPYLTHGFLALPEVLAALRDENEISDQHKLVYEFAWREYFQHVWGHAGEGIFSSMQTGVLPDASYAAELPADIREGRTGVPVIDMAVRELYATGWLHNHARMWLASYCVHLRKVHWRAGADWLYAHLLDGDLASNHLSWQWVAGTASHKPYLFNAENVARYAPAPWQSPGTAIDTSYEALDRIARSAGSVEVAGGQAVSEPELFTEPPPGVIDAELTGAELFPSQGFWLVHPWALGEPPVGVRCIGIFFAEFHRRWPWSAQRWRFVTTRMTELCERVLWCESTPVPSHARSLANPHALPWLQRAQCEPVPKLFVEPSTRSASFSQFWTRVNRRG